VSFCAESKMKRRFGGKRIGSEENCDFCEIQNI
jgi:hypothetical protein